MKPEYKTYKQTSDFLRPKALGGENEKQQLYLGFGADKGT